MTADCIFCRIAGRELPASIIHEDDLAIAFLDLHPIREGHALVIPKAHHTWFEDLPVATASRMMTMGQDLARAMKAEWKVERVAFFYTGIHVAHAHAHVVPMHHVHDVTSLAYLRDGEAGYSQPPRPDDQALAAIADRLRRRL